MFFARKSKIGGAFKSSCQGNFNGGAGFYILALLDGKNGPKMPEKSQKNAKNPIFARQSKIGGAFKLPRQGYFNGGAGFYILES